MDDKKLVDTITGIFEKLLAKALERYDSHAIRIEEEYQKLSREAERLTSRVEKLLGAPRCPTCGRKN